MIIYPILSACFAASSYALTKFFLVNKYINCNVDMVTVMFHTNIINLFLFFLYYTYKWIISEPLFNFRKSFVNLYSLWQLFLLGLPVFASIMKSHLASNIPLTTIEVSSMMKPFFISLLAILLLKEKFKIKYIFCFIVALLGFYIVNTKKFVFNEKVINTFFDDKTTVLLISYVFISAMGNITRKYYCNKRSNDMEVICAEYLVFFIYGTTILIISKTFSMSLLFNRYVFCISLLTLSHHYCTIHGVKSIKSVVLVELLSFSKTIFTLFFGWILLNEDISLQKLTGAVIIFISILMSKLL